MSKVVGVIICLVLVVNAWPLLVVLLGAILTYKLYERFYFRGSEFCKIKEDISQYVNDCNELNAHIEELRSTYADFKKTDYGEASFSNISKQKYKKKGIAEAKYSPYVYDCSKTVCDNARKQPFKYICKYFNIKPTEENLGKFEDVLNNFAAAEDGKILLKKKRDEILSDIDIRIPFLIKQFSHKKLEENLGFYEYCFNELYFPVFSFRYISAGGNSGSQFDVTMNIDTLERFVGYLAETIKFQKSAQGQRRLMTPKLRRYIIERDQCTCKHCGNSTSIEPNLLLEVDHIVPVSKGGMTTEENLQTLCWKCNRHKGAKTEPVAS